MPPSATPRPSSPSSPSRRSWPLLRRRMAAGAARTYSRVLMKRPPALWTVPAPDGRYGEGGGDPLTLLMLGDSLAQGLGAGTAEETFGARLAHGLAAASGRPVDLRVFARVGATTAAMRSQVTRAAALPAGVAVVIVGANDAMLPRSIARAGHEFTHAVGELREQGWELVVIPCADPGQAPGVRSLCRVIASRRARRLARIQTRAALRADAQLAPSSESGFAVRAEELLGPDGVHPSPLGYAEHAERMLPSLRAAALLATPSRTPARSASPGR